MMSQTIAPFNIGKVQAACNTRAARNAFLPFTQRTLTYDDGIAVGHLLSRLGIPGRYVKHTCSTILWDWKFPEERVKAWATNEDFVQGLGDGYYRTTDEFAELEIGEDDGWEERGPTSLGGGCRAQLSRSKEEYDAYSDAGIAPEIPLQSDQTFMDFMADIEKAAFSERQSLHGVSDDNLEDRVVWEAVPRSCDD